KKGQCPCRGLVSFIVSLSLAKTCLDSNSWPGPFAISIWDSMIDMFKFRLKSLKPSEIKPKFFLASNSNPYTSADGEFLGVNWFGAITENATNSIGSLKLLYKLLTANICDSSPKTSNLKSKLSMYEGVKSMFPRKITPVNKSAICTNDFSLKLGLAVVFE